MKRILVFFLALGGMISSSKAQEVALRKGVVVDSLPLNDSIARQLVLYLPTDFDGSKKWPLVFLCDIEEDAGKKMRYLRTIADKNGFIMASSRSLADTANLTQKILAINASLEELRELLPLDLNRVYTAGYDTGGQLAAIVPSMIRGVEGVLGVASGLPNLELINPKEPYEFVGIMGMGDYQYWNSLTIESILDQRKLPNFMLYHMDGHKWPDLKYLDIGFQIFTLRGMKTGKIPRDEARIQATLSDYTRLIQELAEMNQLILVRHYAEQGEDLFEGLANTEWFRNREKEVRKSKAFKEQKREWDNVRLKETLLTQDYSFYLEEDVLSFNLDNLGWWKHQMEEIEEYKKSSKRSEQLMGIRLEGYLNALVDEYVVLSGKEPDPDYDGLILLNMLKTITAPSDYDSYLQVISLTAKFGDFGTANYYLESLLEAGYTDADHLYQLPNTGLLRISPEFNAIIDAYLGAARYAVE